MNPERIFTEIPKIGFAKDLNFIQAAEILNGKLIQDENQNFIGVSWGNNNSISWKEYPDKNNKKQLAFIDLSVNGAYGNINSITHITNWGLVIPKENTIILVHPPVFEKHIQGYNLTKQGKQSFAGPDYIFSDAIRAANKLLKHNNL